MKHIEFENPLWQNTVRLLKKLNRPFWRRVLELVDRSRRKRIEVNMRKINMFYKEGKIVIVPGKLLGGERLKHRAKIVAVDASKKVIRDIQKNGGEFIYMEDFLKNLNDIRYSDLMIIR
ncbi:MAG: uL15 family ribosomal protein [Candidatus Anstonellales archaeon]